MVKKAVSIVLASASPRRREFVGFLGLPVVFESPNIDETPLKREAADKMVLRLARKKAFAVFESRKKIRRGLSNAISEVILAADTTVVSSRGKILGKPSDAAEAFQMIKSLSGKKHWVYTAYCLVSSNKKCVQRLVKTAVYFYKLSDLEVRNYISKGESLDKAGGYAAQGYGQLLIEKIEGSYTNVVGLPMAQLVADLKKMVPAYRVFSGL